jgi:hypothetical protein
MIQTGTSVEYSCLSTREEGIEKVADSREESRKRM